MAGTIDQYWMFENREEPLADWQIEQRKKVIAAVEALSDGVNTMTRDPKDFLHVFSMQHPTLQQSMIGLFFQVIAHVGAPEYRTDPRNEYAKELCAKVIQLMKDNDLGTYLPCI